MQIRLPLEVFAGGIVELNIAILVQPRSRK